MRAGLLLLLCLAAAVASAADWTRFRGANGDGVSSDAKPPADFSDPDALVWRAPLPPGHSSPILIGDRLLLVGIPGVALVVSANPALEILARAELGETVHASPALVDGRLYLRGKDHLHAIGITTTGPVTPPDEP